MPCRARLAEVFVERKEHHKGIAATMPNGILGQDFAIQHLQVTLSYNCDRPFLIAEQVTTLPLTWSKACEILHMRLASCSKQDVKPDQMALHLRGGHTLCRHVSSWMR